MTSYQNIYTLLCHRDIKMAEITLPKILSFLSPGQKLYVFDDGSFTKEDAEWCASLSDSIVIKELSGRNEQIQDLLAKYPNCLNYRKEFPLAFKLLDIPLIAGKTSERITFTDADIIYLKGCNGYFNRGINTYLRTDAVKLSVKLQHVFFKYNWKVPFCFNSGYFSFDLNGFDLDFLEYYLGLPDVRNIRWLSEQTAWALLFGRAGKSFCPDIGQFVCRESFQGPVASTLAIHLIGLTKKYVQDWSNPVAPGTEEIPRFMESRNVTVMDWVKKNAERFTSRL